MILKEYDPEREIETQYTVKALTDLKKKLQCKNLRKALIEAANEEDYETLCKALSAFSSGKIQGDAAYHLIDTYVKDNGVSAYEMFLQLIVEIGESGFFREKSSIEDLRKLADSPEIDTGELVEAVMEELKDGGIKDLARAMMTGAATSTTSGSLLTPAG